MTQERDEQGRFVRAFREWQTNGPPMAAFAMPPVDDSYGTTSARAFGTHVAAFYRSLVGNHVPPDHARYITGEWLHSMAEMVKRQQGDE